MAGTPEQWIGVYMNKSEEFRKKYLVFEKKWQESEKQYLEYRKTTEASIEGYRQYQKKYLECGAALEEETRQKLQAAKSNEVLKNEVQTLKADYSKLEKHAKNCEKATNKAQKDEKGAKGHAEHLINSQKGQLKNAERRYEIAARELKAWKDRYGESVNKPAEDLHALQVSVTEWQTKAEQARIEITSLEGQIQGTPEQIGLHQALETWDEHQGCSKEFAELEDKLDDSKRREKKLQSELAASKQQFQKAKAANRAPQTKNQHEQTTEDQQKTNGYMERIVELESALKASAEENKTLQENVNRLKEDKENLQVPEKIDVDMTDDDMLEKSKLSSEFKALQELHQQKLSEMNAIQAKNQQLAQDNSAFQVYDKTRDELFEKLKSEHQTTKSDTEIVQRQANQLQSQLSITEQEKQNLESNLKTATAEYQAMKSNIDIIQRQADQLQSQLSVTKQEKQNSESDLRTAKAGYQAMKSNMEIFKRQADQLKSQLSSTKQEKQNSESNLRTATAEYQATKSNIEALQGKVDQLKKDLESTLERYQKKKSEADKLESDLSTTRERYQTIKSDKKILQEKADSLEKENERLLIEASEKSGQDKVGNNEMANAVQPNTEERVESRKKGTISGKPEQVANAQQSRVGSSKGAEISHVTPPSSPLYTTDDGSQDLEKTPRPKNSLRHDLGISSHEHTDEEHSSQEQSKEEQPNGLGMGQQGTMMSKQSETGEEKDLGGVICKKCSEKVEELASGSTVRGKRTLFTIKRSAQNFELRANERAKEQAESLESIFECTPAKAKAIDRRLKALGPGCRLHEAPALVANELSGIPEEAYKGLASGKLITTEPRNEVKDMGTNPVVLATEVSTQTADLAPEQVAATPYSSRDVTTDTTDLITFVRVPVSTIVRELTALIPLLLLALVLITTAVHLYTGLKGDSYPNSGHYVLQRHIYSQRYTSASSHFAQTPVRFVFPPTPAPQLGLMRMMYGSSRGGGPLETMW